MKTRHCLFPLLAAAALCGCDSSLDAPPAMPIAFGEAWVDMCQRGALTTENVEAMVVYGYESVSFPKDTVDNICIFPQTLMPKRGGVWTYSPQQYWVPEKYYQFVALAPTPGIPPGDLVTAYDYYQVENWLVRGMNPDWRSVLTVSVTPNGEDEVLVSRGVIRNTIGMAAQGQCPAPVSFSMLHSMTQVMLTVVDQAAQSSQGSTFHRVSAQISGFERGSFTLTADGQGVQWSFPTNPEPDEVQFPFALSHPPGSLDYESEPLYILPNYSLQAPQQIVNQCKLTVSVQAFTTASEVVSGTAAAPDTIAVTPQRQFTLPVVTTSGSTLPLLPGHSYNFIVTLALHSIDFRVEELRGWQTENRPMD